MFKWAKNKKINQVKEVVSPSGRNKFVFTIKNGQISYEIRRDNKTVVAASKLGFRFFGEEPLGQNLRIVRTTERNHTEEVELPWGENRLISNNYRELAVYLVEPNCPKRIFTVRARIFDDAIAFRYEIPPQPKFQRLAVADEMTEFNVDPNSIAWHIPAYEPDRYEYNYTKSTIYDLDHPVHTPLTIKTPNGYYLSIHEAALYNYGSMTLKPDTGKKLFSDITPLSDGTRAHIDLPFETPWRLVMLSDSAIELTMNHAMLCLNEPPDGDFSWVKPLKFLGIWWAMYVGEWTWAPGERHGATTRHAKEYIDAAVQLGIRGLLIEGWNDGWEGNWLENGINNKFTVSTSDFDLATVAKYAEEKGIELVGHHETVGFIDNYNRQLEESYNYYAMHHIHYIKTGYAGSRMLINGHREFHHSQLGVMHYQKTVELAARKRISLDIHEPIKGTGIERTWPNLLTREGARGQEYEGGALSPSHACILPYTRLLSGGMDYTNGIFDILNNVKRISTTISRQLAYFVTVYSGMTMAADRPHIYREERFKNLFKFIQSVPVNFEITRPIAGEIGEYYIVARKDRASDDWYIGGVTNEQGRRALINLNFLDDGTYEAIIYKDSADAHYRDNPFGHEIVNQYVGKTDSLGIYIAPGGGFAIRLIKR